MCIGREIIKLAKRNYYTIPYFQILINRIAQRPVLTAHTVHSTVHRIIAQCTTLLHSAQVYCTVPTQHNCTVHRTLHSTQYNCTMHRTTVQYSAQQNCTVHRAMVQYTAQWHNAQHNCTVHNTIAQFTGLLYSAQQNCTVHRTIVQYTAQQHSA